MFKSLRTQMLVGQAVVLTVVVVGFGAVLFDRVRRATYEQIDADLLGAAQLIDARRASTSSDAATLEIPESYRQRFGPGPNEAAYAAVWDAAGNLRVATPNAPHNSQPEPERHLGKKPKQWHHRDQAAMREIVIRAADGGQVMVGRSIHKELDHLQRLLVGTVVWGAAALVVGLGGAWWIARRIVRPIAAMTTVAERVTAQSLDERIEVRTAKSELARLAEVLNGMFARLREAFDRQTRFTADASHELRTPLAVLLAQTESALARERPADEYRESLEACRRAALRMKELVESLLALARLDGTRIAAARDVVDLPRLIDERLAAWRERAGAHDVRLAAETTPVTIAGDVASLGRLLDNLLDNAIKYNRPDGTVDVTAHADGEWVELIVADTGRGIATEHLPHLGERFYRTDAARNSADGGVGLGLALCREIVAGHAGTLEIRSTPGIGTQVVVRLPLGRIATEAVADDAAAVVSIDEPAATAVAAPSA